MREPSQRPENWTLWGSGIMVQAGQLIEYQDSPSQIRVARVQMVTESSLPHYGNMQRVHAKIYGPLTKMDGKRRERIIHPEKVIRVLDTPPPPAVKVKELTSLWSPRDSENPFQIQSMLTNEEWLKITRWYSFSVRALKVLGSDARWQEQARTSSWNEAKEAMTTLAQLHYEKYHCWVVMKGELRGKEGREKPVLWSPSQYTVERAIRG